jgi:hypothetical protein
MWFKITPTKIEKYLLLKPYGYFLKHIFEKFILFSKKHHLMRAYSRKILKKEPKIGKLKTSWD